MKPMRILVFIALLIPAFVFSQPSILAGQIADLLARIQQLPAHGTDAEQELAQILAAADVEPVSPVALRSLLYLLRQQAPEGMLREHLLASVVRKGAGRSQEPAALLANVPPVARFDDRARGAAAQSSLIPVLEDFQVNDSYNPCHNYDPVISVNDRGDFVVVWADDCYGGSNIACQRFSADGTKQGIVLMPNNSTCYGGHEIGYTNPVVTLGNNGSFVVAWLDWFNYEPDIYCQRYDANGNRLGGNFRVHDDGGGFSQYAPAIAIDDSGNFIVVWLDARNGTSQIYFQRYDANGARQGGNCRLYDDSLSFSQSSPDICVDAGGNFWIVWADNRNGNYDIYGQHFDAGGTKIDTTFRIDDDSTGSDQYATKVEIDGNGDLLVAWIDLRNGNKDIYCQRLDANGGQPGANRQVNDDSNGSIQYSPSIGVDASGNFVLLWLDDRSGTFDIYCQQFDAGGVRQKGNFRIRHDAEQMTRYSPSVGMDARGNFVAVWQGKRDWIGEIYGQRYDANGMEQNANFKINGESALDRYESPAIGVDSSGNFSIVWGYNNYDGLEYDGVYSQRFSAQGVKMGARFKVDNTDDNYEKTFPAIGVNASGRFVVAWQDRRNGNYDVYFRCYDANGVVPDEDFPINDDDWKLKAFQGVPAVGLDENDNIVVVWQDQRRGNHDIFYQAYHPLSGFIGVNSQTNSDAGTSSQTCPALGLSPSGKFVVVWQDNRHGDDDIFGQRYRSFEDSLGGNFRINDDGSQSIQSSPAVSMDLNGNFVVAWVDRRNGNRDIYGQCYAANGARRGVNFHVNDSPVGFDAISPAVAMDETGNFVIVWQYIRENKQDDIYAQIYDHLGNPAGVNYRIDNIDGLEYQGNPDVKMANGLIYYTWEDSRCRGGNTSIFARVDRSPFKKMIISPAIHAHALAEEFYVDILLSDVLNLFSLSFKLNFPADKIDAIAAEAGDFLGADVGFFAEIHKNTGAVRIYLSKKGGQDGSDGTGVVARIKLKEKPSVNNGIPILLSLSDVVAHDPQGDAISLTPENSSYITPTPTSVADKTQPLPDQYALLPNYPNPFNPTTTICYALPEAAHVKVQIFDMNGREVKRLVNEVLSAGIHSVAWNGTDESQHKVASGIYICRLNAGEVVFNRKLVLTK